MTNKVLAQQLASDRGALVEPEQSSASSNFYLPGLNQLRFLAALAVLVHHLEAFKDLFGLKNISEWMPIQLMGREGVRLFFVLSGFLIIALLIKELDRTGKIDIKNFYTRRVLRIWPLYFLITYLGFFVLPALLNFPDSASPRLFGWQAALFDQFWQKLLLFICFLPNYCLVKFPPVSGAAHLWSLGVEEQFYLFCPILILVFRRHILAGLATALALKWGALWLIVYSLKHTVLRHSAEAIAQGNIIHETLWKVEVESFVAGGIAAYLFVKHPQIATRIGKSKLMTALAASTAFSCFFWDTPYRVTLITIAFALCILTMASNDGIKGKAGQAINYLGKISYGLYMFHPLIMCLVLPCILELNLNWFKTHALYFDLLAYTSTISLTVGLSAISFKFFEKPFLSLKEKLAVVKTGAETISA